MTLFLSGCIHISNICEISSSWFPSLLSYLWHSSQIVKPCSSVKSCPANEWGWNRLIKTGTSGNQNTALQSTPRPKVESFRKISSSCCNLDRIILIIRRKYNFSTKVESNLICFASRWIYNLSIIKGELWPSAIIYVIHPLWIKEWRNFEGQLSSLIWGNNFAWGGWCEREWTLLINRAAAFVPQLALLPQGVSQKARIRNSKLGQNYSSSPPRKGRWRL